MLHHISVPLPAIKVLSPLLPTLSRFPVAKSALALLRFPCFALGPAATAVGNGRIWVEPDRLGKIADCFCRSRPYRRTLDVDRSHRGLRRVLNVLLRADSFGRCQSDLCQVVSGIRTLHTDYGMLWDIMKVISALVADKRL